MRLEDQLSILATAVSLLGLAGFVFWQPVQEPVSTTLGALHELPEQSTVQFFARVEKWKAFQSFDRLTLNDGNQVSALWPRSKPKPPSFENNIFQFTARVEQTRPSLKLVILEAHPLD